MEPASRLRGRGREAAVLAAGLCAAGALVWAGATVHEGLATAGQVAVARLASAVEETVKAEWQRMLRASEMPVKPAGEVFKWKEGERKLSDLSLVDPRFGEIRFGHGTESRKPSVYSTLLDEAGRRELIEHDDAGALDLVLEALEKWTDGDAGPEEGWLRALQLGARVGRDDVVGVQWEHLRETKTFRETGEFARTMPYRVLAWLSLPQDFRGSVPASTVLTREQLERFDLLEDRLDLGPEEEPEARFELSPTVSVVRERMGLPHPPLERRKVHALERLSRLPQNFAEGQWTLQVFAGRPFLVRREGSEFTASFCRPEELQDALRELSTLPAGFRLDFDGGREDLGPAVRPRTRLTDSSFDFTLRHSDPASLGKAEAARLKLLRGALFVLALACAAGGFLTARVLARQRKLAALKSAFVAGVSHDLRTPLAAILLLTENLESGAAGADPARTHRALRKEATRLRRLVDDVLDFSRLERGEAPRLEREDVELAPFLDELEAEFRARVEAAGRAFALERGALPASAALDPHAVRRALENLLDNALQHGKGAVRLACTVVDAHLVLTVADEGPGVPAGERERAFEPFERLSAANGHAGGTGLGLAIVRAIARGHGGEARIRAGAGAGCVFELDLPLPAPEAAEEST